MQFYKHNTGRDSTHKQAGGWSVDAALFVEELVEIYSTPTPNAMAKAETILFIECWAPCIITRSNIYTRNLNMNPTQIRLITILGIKENFLT